MRTARPRTVEARPGPGARVVLVGVLSTTVGLAGCGGTGQQPEPVRSTVTVTAAPSAPASASGPPPEASSPAPTAEPSAEPSGDPAALPKQDRGFDVAFLRGRTDTPDGVVLQIDRLTVVGVADEDLAAAGTPVVVDDGTRFTNQAERLYDVGVAPTARFFLTTCAPGESGPSISSEPVDLDTFLAAPGLDGTAVTLRYADGLLDRAETNPRC